MTASKSSSFLYQISESFQVHLSNTYREYCAVRTLFLKSKEIRSKEHVKEHVNVL
jgi:hypothetical protein